MSTQRHIFLRMSSILVSHKRSNESNKNSPLLAALMVVRDVRTRWNSTHAMIDRALLLREVRLDLFGISVYSPIVQAINDWVYSMPEYRELALSNAEWERLRILRDLLEVSYFSYSYQ